MAPVLETFGQRLLAARRAAKLSQRELADRVGKHEKTVSRWENDSQLPEDSVLSAMADALATTPEWLRSGISAQDARPAAGERAAPNPHYRNRLSPRAYATLYGFLERLREAGADEEQLDEAERIMADERYAKLRKRGARERSEDDVIADIEAGWALVWELATRGGLKVPGPRPPFEEG